MSISSNLVSVSPLYLPLPLNTIRIAHFYGKFSFKWLSHTHTHLTLSIFTFTILSYIIYLSWLLLLHRPCLYQKPFGFSGWGSHHWRLPVIWRRGLLFLLEEGWAPGNKPTVGCIPGVPRRHSRGTEALPSCVQAITEAQYGTPCFSSLWKTLRCCRADLPAKKSTHWLWKLWEPTAFVTEQSLLVTLFWIFYDWLGAEQDLQFQ